MKLQEVFDQLTYGELSQLSIGGGEAGMIAPVAYDRVLAHVNLGLATLYKRFLLKEGRITLQLSPVQEEYKLLSKYAVSSKTSKEPVRYIKDSAASPFKDDIIKVERVLGDTGWEYNLNNMDDKLGMVTPTATVLRVPKDILIPPNDLPEDMRTANLELVYRAAHPAITPEGVDLEPDMVELELPYTHLEPLLLFIASRVHTPTGMMNETNMGNTYFARYEAACQQLENAGLLLDRASQTNRLERGGWV